MATAREDRSYDGGLGTGGKFRKRPFRRFQASTPYDRPPTALRNPTTASNGWLSKLVDPAQRLISAGARRLFSSVFRKRLMPPLRYPSAEVSQDPRDEHRETAYSDPSGAQEVPINTNYVPNNGSSRGELIELEQILKQKTFTRSEVDRLTTLLRSKSDEMPVENEEQRFEMVPSKPMTSLDRKEGYPYTIVQENGTENRLTATPVVRETVLDDDVASPAELAKAYMGTRPSKVSPSMLGSRSQTFREDSNVISNPPLPPRSPVMSLVPRASGHISAPLNGFTTPRSRGRSAIYSMARTPYSRVHRTTTIKDAGLIIDAFGGPSPPHETELNRPSGSQHGALKRRSSVLDNDIGSVGPVRRIRQKPNLVTQKGLGLPVSSQYPSSSLKLLTENGDNSMPSSAFTPIPSKSKDMASKILQQLEKLTPKEKSPTKLSPSMLRGKALKSLENPDSSKVFECVHDNNKSDGLVESSVPDAQKSTSLKKDKVMANGPTKSLFLCDAYAEKGVNDAVSNKDTVPSVNIDNTTLPNSIAHPPQKKQAFRMSAHEDFLDLDDDILTNGVASTPSVEPRAKLDNSVSESKTVSPEAVIEAKPSSEGKLPTGSILNEKSYFGASDRSVIVEKSSGFAFSAASSVTAQPAVEATQSSFASDKPAVSKEWNAPCPIFSFGDKVVPSKEASAATPTFGLGSKNADKLPQSLFVSSSTLADSSGLKWESSSDPKPESLSSSAAFAGTIDSAPEVAASTEGCSANSISGFKSEDFSKTPETAQSSVISTSTLSAGIFTPGASSNSALNNGSHSSSTNQFSSSAAPLFSGNITSQNSFSSAAFATVPNSIATPTIISCSLPLSAPDSSSTAAPLFKFGASGSASPTAGGPVVQSVEAKINQDTKFGNASSTISGGASVAPASTGSSIFSFSAAAASANTQSHGPIFGTSSGSFSSPAVSAVATVTQSLPTQFVSSASTTFGLSSSSSFSFGSSPFGSNPPAGALPSSASGSGASPSASSSDANIVSSSTATASALFGSSSQSTKSPLFAPSFSSTPSSTGFSFGVSSASTTSASMPFGSTPSSAVANSTPFGSTTGASSPMPFGSTTGASSGSLFSFTSTAAGSSNGTLSGSGFSTSASPTTSQPVFGNPAPVFGNPAPVFGFGSASASAGNDQMNMEDSMAEDNVQASMTPAPIFSQQPLAPTPSSFGFGSTTPAGANPFQFGGQQNTAVQPFQFGGQQQTATQPFQFGGQQNTATTPQISPSPFQASGSLDFSASGNFSLGSGGGDKSSRRIVKVNKLKNRRK